MAPDEEDDFRRFVEAHGMGLVRSAYLLVGDRGAAEDLVQQTLATVYRHWDREVRDGAPLAHVRAAMVVNAISDSRRSRVNKVDDRNLVVWALRDLPPRMRAVMVLRYADDLAEAATADVLDMPVGSVRSHTSHGLQRLRAVLPGRPDRGDAPPSTRLEDEVREALRAATKHLAAPRDPYAQVMETVDARRRRRRAIVSGSGIAALVLAAVVGLAAGVTDDEPRASTAAIEQQPALIPRWGLPFDWPARGELGTDPEFADAFARGLGADHHLVYAEDGAAGRVVIAVSPAQEAVVFHGPPGAADDELERVTGLLVDTRDIAVALPVDDGHLIIVLMPAHLNEVQISVPSVARDGSIERQWRRLPVDRGIAHVVSSDPLGVIRVRTPAGDGPPHVMVGAEAPLGTLTCGRCDRVWFATEGLAEFHAQAAAAVGAEPEDVTARLVLDAALPAPTGAPGPEGDAPGRVVGYVATLPSGGLLRATYVATTGPGAPTVAMVEPLRPLPADDPSRPVLIPSGEAGSALIVAPGSSRVAFTPREGAASVSDAILADGVGVLTDSPRDPAEYRITSFAPDGTLLRTWHGSVLETDDPLEVFNRFWNRGSN